MKTVQEYLKEFNHNQLIEDYFERVKDIIYQEQSVQDKSIQEVNIQYKKKIKEYIEHLCELSSKEKTPEYVIFAYEGYVFETFTEPVVTLVKIDEILKAEKMINIESYSYEFMDNSEIINFLVAETEYNKNHIQDILGDILYESSFFGFTEDRKREERENLMTIAKEIKEDNLKTKKWSEVKEMFSDIYHYEKSDIEKYLETEIRTTIRLFNNYSRIKQLYLIKNEITQ